MVNRRDRTRLLLYSLIVAMMPAASAAQSSAVHGLRPGDMALTFGRGSSVGNAVIEVANGDFVTVGYTTGGEAGGEDVLVVRTTARGKTVWTRTIGSPADDSGWAIAERKGGGLFVAGFTSGYGANGEDVLLIALKETGETEWVKTAGGPGNQRAWAITPAGADAFVLAAQTDAGPFGGLDALVMKVKTTGDVVWTRAFGGPAADRLFGVAPSPDGGVVVTGSSQAAAGGPLAMLAAKLDSAGQIVWERRHGGSQSDLGHDVIALDDGGFLVTGYGQSFGKGGANDVYLIKLDAAGRVLWTRTSGGPGDDRGLMSARRLGGGFITIGYRQTPDADWEIWLGESSADGTFLTERMLGSDGPDRGVMIMRPRAGGYMMTGQLGNIRDGTSLLLLIRLV